MTKAKAKNNTQQSMHSKPKEKSATQKALDETPIQVYSIDNQKIDATFSETTSQPLDLFKNVSSDRPEIIALSNFLPCYTNAGNLNEIGEFFQIKQDALLITCVDTINNILETIPTESEQTTINYIDNTRTELLDFCTKIEDDITDLVSAFEDTKKILNPKKDISVEVKGLQDIPSTFKIFDKFETITKCNPDTIKNWTNTKLWLQLCKEYKEALRSGVCKDDGLFVMKKSSPSDSSMQDPFSIFNPKNYDQKFDFNSKQSEVPSDVFNPELQFNVDVKNTYYNVFKNVFTNDEKSILNVPMGDLIRSGDKKEKGKTLARLSYLISREFRYSDKLRLMSQAQSPSHSLLTSLGYSSTKISPSTTTDNRLFWDFFIGRFGDDITQIPSQNRLINNYNLTSLSQFVATRTTTQQTAQQEFEVLSFENRYINDDIGANRQSILTPGSAFLVDDVFTSNTSDLFNTSDINLFRNKLKTTITNLKEITGLNSSVRSWMFDNISPRTKLQIVTGTTNDSADQDADTDQTPENKPGQDLLDKEIRNPLLLLRRLEQDLLNSEGFLTRTGLPNSIVDNDTTDLGRVLIARALADYENSGRHLLTNIFLYVVFKTNSIIKAQNGNDSYSSAFSSLRTEFKTYLENYYKNNKNEIKLGTGGDPNVKSVNLNAPINYKTFDNIAEFMSKLLKKFKVADSTADISDQFSFRNPFTANVDRQKTYYSRVSLESMMVLLFLMCCLILDDTNQEIIVGYASNAATIRKSNKEAISKYVYVDEQGSIVTLTLELAKSFRNEKDTIQVYNYYHYDDIILYAENFINDEILSVRKLSSYFLCYLSVLEAKFNDFINNFEAGTIANNAISIRTNLNLILSTSTTLGTQQIDRLISEIFSIEQLRLVKSKLAYMKVRFQENYNSLVRSLVVPYFTSLKDEDSKIIDGCLPLEDVHLVSWKFFLKSYLNKWEFRNPWANNSKILSVGIPHKLYRKLQKPIDASSLQSTINDANLICINVYLVDNLRPLLVYKPQKFIFDINKFSIRTLNSYEDYLAELPPSFDKENIVFPFLNLNDFQSKFSKSTNLKKVDYQNNLDELYALKYKNFIDPSQYMQLIKNHTNNFMLEEYLRFITGQSFDEHAFYNYNKTLTNFDETLINSQISLTEGAIQYLKNTSFIGVDAIKNSLICPKKFDRVFHLYFDPEKFIVDEEKIQSLNSGNTGIIQYYENNSDIVKVQLSSSSNEYYYRRGGSIQTGQTDDRKLEFDSYFVELEMIA